MYGTLVGIALATGAGLLWVWATLGVWMLARFAAMGGRFVTDRWALPGAVRAP